MGRVKSSSTNTAPGKPPATSKTSTPKKVANKHPSKVDHQARPPRKFRRVRAKLMGKAPEPGPPYQAWEELDPAIFPEYARGAIAKKPLPRPELTSEEDLFVGADSDEDMSSKQYYEDGSTPLFLNLGTTKVDPETRLDAPRAAAPRKIIADPTNEIDKTILKMKVDGFTDRQVADRIREMPGGIDYNIKTIGTRHKRLKLAAAKKRDEELDAQLTDWHDGDDEALFKANSKAEKEIRKQQKQLEEVHKWRLVAQYLKQAKPASAYSEKACRKRIEAISNGFAAIPPELEDGSLASAIISQNCQAAKAAKERLYTATAQVILSTKNLSVVSPTNKRDTPVVAEKLDQEAQNLALPCALGFDGNEDSDATIEDGVLTDLDEPEDIDADDEAGGLDEEEYPLIKRAAVPPVSRRISIRGPTRRTTYISSNTEDSDDDADGEITSDESLASQATLSARDITDEMEGASKPATGRTAEEQAEMDKQREHEEWEVKIALGMVAIEDTPLYDGRSRIPPFKPAVLPFFEGSIRTKSGVYHGFPAGYHEMVKESMERAATAHEEASDPAKERAALALQLIPNRGPTAPEKPQKPATASTQQVTPSSLAVPTKANQNTKRVSNVGAGGASAKKPKLSNYGKKATKTTENKQGIVSSELAGTVTEMSRVEQEFARTHLTRLLTTDKKIRDDPKAWDTHLFKGLSEMTCRWLFKMKDEVDPDWVLEPEAHRKWYKYATTTFPELFDYERPI